MSIDDYCRLDFNDAAVRQSLISGADSESSATATIRLTDDLGVYPSGLTPAMRGWYMQNVEARRLGALADLAAQFAKTKMRGVAASVLEQRLDEVEQKRIISSQRAIDSFHERNAGIARELNDAERLYQESRRDYGERDPISPAPALYWGGLLVIVGLEIAINFESFRQMPYITSMFLATGATLIIALAFGFASHVHGTVWKQRKYQFGPAEYNRQKQGLWLFSIGSALLFFGISSVGAARYYYLLPKIQEALLTGSAPPSLPFSIGFMLLGNVLVYLLGCVWAFMNHDEDPEYPKRHRRYKLLSEKYDNLFKRNLAPHLDQLKRKAQEEAEKARNTDRVLRQDGSYEEQLKAVARIKEQDAGVEVQPAIVVN